MSRTTPSTTAELPPRLIRRVWPKPALPMHVVIAIFVGVVCAALIGIDAWWAWSARTIQLESAQSEAMTLAERVAQQAESVFDVADDMLLGLAERMQVDGTSPAALQRTAAAAGAAGGGLSAAV